MRVGKSLQLQGDLYAMLYVSLVRHEYLYAYKDAQKAKEADSAKA